MPRKPKTPRYLLHRRSGQAIVTLPNPLGGRGRDVYLGPDGSPESHERYKRLIAEWKARGKHDAPTDVTIVEIVALYADHCKARYSRGRRLAIGAAMKPLTALYGRTLAAEFDALKLEAVRVAMVEQFKWCRNTVNEQVRWVRSLFKWAVRYRHVPANVLVMLQQVPALAPGELGVEESEPVLPVEDDAIDAIQKHCYQVCWLMVRLQRLTAMRPKELCDMRLVDIDMRRPVWLYKPSQHKNAHRGMTRIIPLGKAEQEIIRPLVSKRVDAFIFHTGDGRYITSTRFRKWIGKACRAAKIAEWSPYQLRHARLTELAETHVLEDVAAVAGHRKISTTQRYSGEAMHRRAIAIVSRSA